jgi:hypothetical protein
MKRRLRTVGPGRKPSFEYDDITIMEGVGEGAEITVKNGALTIDCPIGRGAKIIVENGDLIINGDVGANVTIEITATGSSTKYILCCLMPREVPYQLTLKGKVDPSVAIHAVGKVKVPEKMKSRVQYELLGQSSTSTTVSGSSSREGSTDSTPALVPATTGPLPEELLVTDPATTEAVLLSSKETAMKITQGSESVTIPIIAMSRFRRPKDVDEQDELTDIGFNRRNLEM